MCVQHHSQAVLYACFNASCESLHHVYCPNAPPFPLYSPLPQGGTGEAQRQQRGRAGEESQPRPWLLNIAVNMNKTICDERL